MYPERYRLARKVFSQCLKDVFSITTALKAVPTQGVNIDVCIEDCAGSKIGPEKHELIRLSFP